MTDNDLAHLDFDPADPDLELELILADRQAQIESCQRLLERYDAELEHTIGLRGEE
jgi:hypothetical protein